jgi:hypothetical protein
MTDSRKIFSYEEALALLPEVQRLTADAVALVETLVETGEGDDDGGYEIPAELVPRFREVVAAWSDSITGLGIEVKGLWLIDFDSGSGYYCWKHPEPSLQFFHGYDEGFDGRVQLN